MYARIIDNELLKGFLDCAICKLLRSRDERWLNSGIDHEQLMRYSRNKPNHKEFISKFIGVTRTNEKTAQRYLQQSGWNADKAIDNYFKTCASAGKGSTLDRKKVEKLFDRYISGGDKKRILAAGVERLLQDLKIEPTSIEALVLAWILNARVQCEFSDSEFINGMLKCRCENLEQLKSVVVSSNKDLSNPAIFKQLYCFSYNFGKSDPDMKSMDTPMAIAYWRLLLEERYPALLTPWIEYIQRKNRPAIPRDTWDLLLEFLTTTNNDLSNYDEDGAWPVLIDEFVLEIRDQRTEPS